MPFELSNPEDAREMMDITSSIANAILMDQLYFEFIPLALRAYKEITLAVVQETPETIEARASFVYNLGAGIRQATSGFGTMLGGGGGVANLMKSMG